MKNFQSSFFTALVVGAASILATGTAPADQIFVSDNGNNSIEQISENGSSPGTLSPFVPSTSNLSGPTGLAFYGDNLFVANNALSGGGSGFVAEFSQATGAFEGDYATGLNSPRGLVFDSFGNMYVANQMGGTITEVPAGGGPAQTIVTGLPYANALTFGSDGNLYVTNGNAGSSGNNIEKVTLTDGVVNSVSTFVNSGLIDPIGITYDSTGPNAGNFFVVNDQNSVLEFNSLGAAVPPTPFISDLNASDRQDDITVDSAGNIYVTDNGDETVTEYSSSGAILNVYSGEAVNGACYITASFSTDPVPEPSTYVLLTAGLGVLFFASRRNRKVATVRL